MDNGVCQSLCVESGHFSCWKFYCICCFAIFRNIHLTKVRLLTFKGFKLSWIDITKLIDLFDFIGFWFDYCKQKSLMLLDWFCCIDFEIDWVEMICGCCKCVNDNAFHLERYFVIHLYPCCTKSIFWLLLFHTLMYISFLLPIKFYRVWRNSWCNWLVLMLYFLL